MFSIFQTSAPRSARLMVAQGPASTRVRSSTRTPVSGSPWSVTSVPPWLASYLGRQAGMGCAGKMARDGVAIAVIRQHRLHLGADGLRDRASGTEPAARGGMERA